MSQTPQEALKIDNEHPYAKAAAQLNKLIRGGRSLSGHERNCFFLNMKGTSFANTSSVSGFDFADDGRAIAKCDWDFDGDLDFWVANRTAPQVRYLQNEIGSRNHFVAFRLQGTKSNRDAIGARVELKLEDSKQRLVQGVRAGEGFLAQSSKTVHFGLGDETKIAGLSVSWPSGNVEQFSPPTKVDGFYTIVEGRGVLEAWSPPASSPIPAGRDFHVPSYSLATSNLLVQPFPLPPLTYETSAGDKLDLTATTEQPILVNLWAEWCAPCLKELSEWHENRKLLEDAGIKVLAISVDVNSEPGKESSENEPAKKLTELGVDFESGTASEAMIEIVQMVHDSVYDHYQRIPVPTSLLINENGELVGIYKGGVSVQRIVEDVKRYKNPDADSRLPHAGRWIGRLGTHKIATLATQLWDTGFTAEALRFTDRIATYSQAESLRSRVSMAHRLKLASQPAEAMKQLQFAHKIEPQDPEVNLQMGILFAEFGQLPNAAQHFSVALRHTSTPRPEIHANFGNVLRRLNRNTDAESQLRRAIELDENLATAFHGLGLLQASKARYSEALANLGRAVNLEEHNASFRINYALALAGAKQFSKAIGELDVVLSADPKSLTAWIYKGEIYSQANQGDKAMHAFRQVLMMQPKATRVWMRLGQLQEQHGKLVDALKSYESLTSLSPNDHRGPTRIAWILATAPNENIRDGERALKLAQQAASRTKQKDPVVLDVLAAAYAENGNYEKAVQTCQQAISLLRQAVDRPLREEISRHHDIYASKRPFRSESK